MSGNTSFEPKITLRPRSLDETFDLALAYLRTCQKDFLKVFAILTAGVLLIVGGLSYGLDLDWPHRAGLALILVTIMERMVTVYAGRHIFGNEAKNRTAVAAVLKRIPLVLSWGLLASAPILVMLIDPDEEAWIGLGIFCLTFWPFVLASHIYLGEAAFLEQLSVGKAMKRTRTLVMYRFGRALGLIIAQTLVRGMFVLTAMSTTSFIIEFVLQFKDMSDGFIYWSAVGGYILSGPYIALVRLFDYVDARTRREGWDIQVRFNHIAQRTKKERAKRLAA